MRADGFHGATRPGGLPVKLPAVGIGSKGQPRTVADIRLDSTKLLQPPLLLAATAGFLRLPLLQRGVQQRPAGDVAAVNDHQGDGPLLRLPAPVRSQQL